MRDIEFRGLSNSGEWVYGSYVSYYEGYHAIHCQIEPEDDFNNHLVDGQSVGQYTGLKDCNCTKIFEGDIISALDEVSAVYFSDGSFCVGIGHLHIIKINQQYLVNCGFVVIGNIHQNSDLL